MSELPGRADRFDPLTGGGGSPGGAAAAHEAYSFVCLWCMHGWEADFEIHHARDLAGHAKAIYYSGGRVIESPLRHPRCPSCDSDKVRIMRSGRVADAHRSQYGHQ